MGETKKSIIVVADTHFGLYTDTEACDPNAFADFLKWIKDLKSNEKMLKLGVWGTADAGTELVLEPPEKIILLGDMLELWTATNESVLASTIYIIQLLSELDCEKIYILGNHDRDLTYIKGRYPLGTSDIRIIDKDEYWISKGDDDYCFLHGHQFDKYFGLLPWQLMGLFRKAALAFGNWTALIAALFFIDLASVILGFGGIVNIMLCVLLFIISLPFLAFKVGRPLWNSFRTIRYDPIRAREAAADRLDKIWSRFEYALDPDSFLTVVYGHTHSIAIWEESGFLTETSSSTDGYERHLMDVLNLPSWVNESSPSEEESIGTEISHVFLYIPEGFAPIFIGWDAKEKKPYLIPDDVIIEKRKYGNLSNFEQQYNGTLINKDNIEQKLKEIDWPKELIAKWMTGFKTDLAKEESEN